jgi:hypothetical protein
MILNQSLTAPTLGLDTFLTFFNKSEQNEAKTP